MVRLLLPVLVLCAVIGLTFVLDRPQPRADFIFINPGDANTLDPQRMSWMKDLRLGRALFEGLVRVDSTSADQRLLPAVAQRWELSPDGRTFTFHLRPEARWSNGEPVRASDFLFAWRRALLPETASDYSGQFQLIRGGREFFEWRARALDDFKPGDDAAALWTLTLRKFDELVALKAPDDSTLVVTLVRPTPYFLDLCALPVFFPVYPPLVSMYERPDPATGRLNVQSGWTRPGVLVSNGPFMLTSWRFKRDLRLERNPYYWDPSRISLGSIAALVIDDPNSQVLAFRSGAVDWVTDVEPPYRADMLTQKQQFYREHQAQVDSLRAQGLDAIQVDARLPADPRNLIHAFPSFGTYFYNFNCRPKLNDGRDNPFADKRVRKAFAMAVDKQRIVDHIRRIGERPLAAFIPPGSIPGYQSPAGLPFDPVAARALLAAAGFPEGRGFITVELLYSKDGGHDFIAQSIKKDWEQNLGVSVILQQKETKVLKNDLVNQNYMISRASWFGDYGDPTTFLDALRTGDGNNDRAYSSPAFDELMSRADAEPDPAARLRILQQAESLIVDEDLPLIPLFQYVQLYLFDAAALSGLSTHPRQTHNIHEFSHHPGGTDSGGTAPGGTALQSRVPSAPGGTALQSRVPPSSSSTPEAAP